MPHRPSFRALLAREARESDYELRQRARAAAQEALARRELYPPPPVEGRAATKEVPRV